MGKGTGEEQATPTVPPRGEDKRHPGEQWGDSGGTRGGCLPWAQGAPGRHWASAESPLSGPTAKRWTGLPLRLLIATRASHLIKLEILSLFWIYLESDTKLPQPNPHPSSLLAAVFTAATVQLEYTKETQF